MAKMMIYHAIVGAMLMTGANREKVWGVDMLVKTIDPFDETAVNEHKADGWHKSPQDVIDELEKVRLSRESVALRADIDSLKNQKALDDKIAQLTADNERLQYEVGELTAKLAMYETAQDANNDGQVSFDEMTADQLRAYLDSKGVKYEKRTSKDNLVSLAMGVVE